MAELNYLYIRDVKNNSQNDHYLRNARFRNKQFVSGIHLVEYLNKLFTLDISLRACH